MRGRLLSAGVVKLGSVAAAAAAAVRGCCTPSPALLPDEAEHAAAVRPAPTLRVTAAAVAKDPLLVLRLHTQECRQWQSGQVLWRVSKGILVSNTVAQTTCNGIEELLVTPQSLAGNGHMSET